MKRIVGHEIADITEKVYTHRTVEDLKREMEKITKLIVYMLMLIQLNMLENRRLLCLK